MSEPTKTWAEVWEANQQAFMKAIFSAVPAASGDDESTPPLQQQFGDLQQTWSESIEKWTAFVKDGSGPGALTPKALRKMFAPTQWSGPGTGAFDAALQHVIEGPKYATLWDLDRKVAELQHLTQQRDKAVAAFQAVVQRAWNEAFKRFSQGLSSKKADRPNTWRGLTDRWLQVANETLIEAHRTNEFIEAQSRMLRAASDCRLQERKLAESWCEAFHIPTRSEVDELQKAVIELRRELRLQRRRTSLSVEPVRAEASAQPPRATPAKPRRTANA